VTEGDHHEHVNGQSRTATRVPVSLVRLALIRSGSRAPAEVSELALKLPTG